MNFVAVIPARGDSKGIPGKNIRDLAGRPLIYWVCRAAADCTRIDRIFVSTEDDSIRRIVDSLGVEKVEAIERDPKTATDTASTESALLDFAQRKDFEIMVVIQATSPLLTGADLDRGCKLFESGQFDSVISVVRESKFLWSEQPDGSIVPDNYNPANRPRRQNFEGVLVENGAFYIISRAALLESGCRIHGKTGYIEMEPRTGFELDEESDWGIVEYFLSRRFSKQRET